MRRIVATALLAASALVACLPALGQTARSGGDSQKAMQQLQQLASDRSAAQAEALRAKQALADAQKQIAELTKGRDALRARAGDAQAAKNAVEGKERALNDELTQTKARLAELVGKFRETATTLREVEAERARLHTDLDKTGRDYLTCVEHNTELTTLTRDALDRLDGSAGWSRLARAEPFTRLARTRAENLADEYRARLADLRVTAQAGAPAAGVPAPPPESR